MIQLGATVKDIITGYSGIVTGRVSYLTGCNQLLVRQAKLTTEGKMPEPEWIDEARCHEVKGKKPLVLDPVTGILNPGFDREAPKMSASVKIMLSYDSCHFEICKGTDVPVTDQEIDELRKSAQRLADKAVHQYKVATRVAEKNLNSQYEHDALVRQVESIQEGVPEDQRTPEMLARIKALQDLEHAQRGRFAYDYEDDFDESELDEA